MCLLNNSPFRVSLNPVGSLCFPPAYFNEGRDNGTGMIMNAIQKDVELQRDDMYV